MFQLVSEPPDLSVLAEREVPADVVQIIAKALEKDRANRWPDAVSMAEALRVALYGDVIRSRRTPTPTGFRTIANAGSDARVLPRSSSSGGVVLPIDPPQRKRVMRMAGAGAVVVAIATGFFFSSNANGLAKPAGETGASPGTAPAGATPDTTRDTTITAPPKPAAAEKESTVTAEETSESQLRTAFAGEVLSRWRFFSKPVAAELGDRLTSLRAEFVVKIDGAGQLTDVSPVRLSGVAAFDDNAAAALQNVNRVRLGGARSSTGWSFRVTVIGKTVRVRPR